MPILELKGDSVLVLDQLSRMLVRNGYIERGIRELRTILACLPEEVYNRVVIDFTLARGADYYTGFILEGVIPDIHVGSVLGGGRYDNLMLAVGGASERIIRKTSGNSTTHIAPIS